MDAKIIDLYTSLVAADAQMPESSDVHGTINTGIFYLKNLLLNDYNIADDVKMQYYKSISAAIYENIRLIQDRVDDVDKITSGLGDKRGICNSKKVNVVLLGETSSGKTTFLYRMFGETCGETGSIPITAFTVIHKITRNRSYLEIVFRNQFEIKDGDVRDKFIDFLKKYNFYVRFDIRQNLFSPQGEFEMDDKDEFINFIYEANQYPIAFEEITWHHRQSSRKQTEFVEFANIYDMPGTGGQEEHTDNISNSIKKYGADVDVILYLIKPDKGIPSSYALLKDLKKQFDSIGAHPDFYFVYQKPNDSDFNELSENLKTFITKAENSDAINPFDAIEKEYYLKSCVIDARGDEKDKVYADMALATILQRFYLLKAGIFCNSINIPKKSPDGYDIAMDSEIENERKVNSLLYRFLEMKTGERDERGGLPSISDVILSFKHRFDLTSFKCPEPCSQDLMVMLKGLYEDIQKQIDSLFNYLTTRKVSDQVNKVAGFLSDLKDRTINREVPSITDKMPMGKFDKSRYEESFYEEYQKHEEWQKLMYNIQSYHWLRLNYDQKSIRIYARDTADPVIRYLKDYTERLKTIENRLPVFRMLD